ncbi:MAG: hypothetical protein ACRDJ0_14460, partial [Actinomycetota bacterium]
KSDPLLGLKENVIIGKLIPAGTGMSRYRNVSIETTGEGAISDAEAREMFGLPPRTEEEDAARELFGDGLRAVPDASSEDASLSEDEASEETEEVSTAAE